jgi:hypothetical protein
MCFALLFFENRKACVSCLLPPSLLRHPFQILKRSKPWELESGVVSKMRNIEPHVLCCWTS